VYVWDRKRLSLAWLQNTGEYMFMSLAGLTKRPRPARIWVMITFHRIARSTGIDTLLSL